MYSVGHWIESKNLRRNSWYSSWALVAKQLGISKADEKLRRTTPSTGHGYFGLLPLERQVVMVQYLSIKYLVWFFIISYFFVSVCIIVLLKRRKIKIETVPVMGQKKEMEIYNNMATPGSNKKQMQTFFVWFASNNIKLKWTVSVDLFLKNMLIKKPTKLQKSNCKFFYILLHQQIWIIL